MNLRFGQLNVQFCLLHVKQRIPKNYTSFVWPNKTINFVCRLLLLKLLLFWVLSQVHNNKEYSRALEISALNKAQTNYSQLEKEVLSCIFGLKTIHKYLWGQNFTICNDHLTLKSLFAKNKIIIALGSSTLIGGQLSYRPLPI